MKLDLGSFAFGSDLQAGGGNPSWGTALGQGKGLKFTTPGWENILSGMLYKAIPTNKVYMPIGKGGHVYSGLEDDGIQLAALFDQVYINEVRVPAPFIMVIYRDSSVSWDGRRTLKYSDKIEYQLNDNTRIKNADFITAACEALQLNEKADWIISDIYIEDQETLHMFAGIVNPLQSTTYANTNERKAAWIESIKHTISESSVYKKYLAGEEFVTPKDETPEIFQQIFYGAPGTGKSHTINEITEKQPKENVFRTTFHPDSDYATFVGCYKPTKEATSILSLHKLHELYPEFKTKVENRPLHRFITKYYNSFRLLTEKEAESVFDKIETSSTITAEVPKIMAAIEEIPTTSSISYSFVPQTFTKAYLRAWQTEDPVYLVIEEINRGNCAQIFGDLFQLLDRKNGFSEYPIKADNDLAAYIGEQLSKESREGIFETVKSGEELILPPNLFIWATMNTSDQSLFPIDSAFKRRWEWKYLPINNHEDKNYKIKVGGTKYDWWGFLSKINEVIGNTTSSEDKKLGYFFAKANTNSIVTAEQFVGKVLFYLWNDVFKNYGFDNQIFDKGDKKKFDFSDFFKQDGNPNTDMVNMFLGKLDETIDKENSFVEKPKDDKGQEEPSDTEA